MALLVAFLVISVGWFGWSGLQGQAALTPESAPEAALPPPPREGMSKVAQQHLLMSASRAAPPSSLALPASFTGSAACAGCHAAEHQAWQASQHALAMQHATQTTVLGDFNGASFSQDGVRTRFTTRDGKFFVRTDGPDGQLADFQVEYTFGISPLQQYLVALPGGRLQALAIGWDTRPKADGGQRWFRQYPGEKLNFRNELHWTKRAQNWNFMCADCHSSQVKKGFDAATGSFKTTWSEISVGCESCHGPGSAHAAWARNKTADPSKGLTVALDERRGIRWDISPETGNASRSRPRQSEREIEVCAPCHARRAQIAEGYQPGKPTLDHYLPSMLAPGLYHPDGQQRDEVFVWGSWQQSKMQRKGVTCSDCHEPHSQKLRADGNAVCATCHAPSRYQAPAHHHHEAGKPGAQCVNCHMPKASYMVIDRRADHSLRVPRPDLSLTLGTPNACNQCHTDQSPNWTAAALRGWLGRDAKGVQNFGTAFHAADSGQPDAQAGLAAVATDPGESPIARASALQRLAGAAQSIPVAQQLSREVQPLLRLAAAQTANAVPDAQRVGIAGALLSDPLRTVRIEAARALAGLQDRLPAHQAAAWQPAADEFVAAQAYNADRPEAQTALGSFYSRLGQTEPAQAAFAAALKLDPDHVPAYINAADALRQQGQEAEVSAMLRRGLARLPGNAALHHALGLSLVRQQQTPAALQEIALAARLAPDERRYAYVLGVALNSAGRAVEAQRVLTQAVKRWPSDRDLLLALATLQRDSGQRGAARATAQQLLAAYPADAEVRRLADALR